VTAVAEPDKNPPYFRKVNIQTLFCNKTAIKQRNKKHITAEVTQAKPVINFWNLDVAIVHLLILESHITKSMKISFTNGLFFFT
jgi:hypothetical protein